MLYPQENLYRNLTKLDGMWRFFADREGNGEAKGLPGGLPKEARDIAVPASWNEQYSDLFHFHGKGWYERIFFAPLDWDSRPVWLRFGAVSGVCKVWVNETLVLEHTGNALPFEARIDNVLHFGQENRLIVLADSTLDPWSLPPASLEGRQEGRVGFASSYPNVTYDFFPYGGIQRSVWLYTAPANRIEDITVKTDVQGTAGIIRFTLKTTAICKGKVIASVGDQVCEVSLDGVEARGDLRIPDAKLWDIGQPNLYAVNFVLETDESKDCYRLDCGIRTVKVDGNRFLLNGKPVFFKGFGKHEDYSILGKGYNDAIVVKDFGLMRWIGANSFRTSHYPYDEQILSMADRHGVLVIGETPFVGLNERMYRPDILEKAKGVIAEMIARDKNHPSIVMWSLANEPNCESTEAEQFFKGMAETARSLDDTRPITYVAHLEPENNVGYPYYDVVCINKYYGWYVGAGLIDETLDEFKACMDRFYQKFGKPMIVTEFGADAIAGMHCDPPQMFSEEYQNEMVAKQFEAMCEKDYCIGAHVWAFADFKTCQSISRIIVNRKGVFTREREPKMVAHTLHRLWNEKN